MVYQGSFLALAFLSVTSFSSALPENLRGRAPPNPNTCACSPVTEQTPIVSTKTETVQETVYHTASISRQTITATITITRAPVIATETVSVTKSVDEQVTVTCTEVIIEGPDGTATTKTRPPGGDGEHTWTKTRTSHEESETKPPHHDDDDEATKTNGGSATGTHTESGGGGGKPTYPPDGDDGDDNEDDDGDDGNGGTGPKPTSIHTCKHWNGTRCVKPTDGPSLTVVTSTALATATVTGVTTERVLPTYSVCSVSVALVTVYNTVTATIYQSVSSPSTPPVHRPRAPTAALSE
ncbi:hypothetical protein CTA2_1477 [Colletotrichum tanaceti]|uniref:Uncharacterized protein n=1 Tax=Colletotrichum tanaceti TaxID=1306861 RepID=A0A4U6X0L7_9PEZI|nr:hypothetical protein CTA2_1477 [Colletotrichum tanaceti]TKW48908.1 hypothetical protein CTA1_8906 [Colletotrichum tanaceti]